MRRLFVLSALALTALALGSGIGDKAPTLKVGAIVQGQAVSLDKGLHVVGFFAPQYAPSVAALPKVLDLAKKYKGKVDFTEVAVGQEDDEAINGVKKFVASTPKTDVNFAYDSDKKAMETDYLKAFGPVAPPAVFLIKDGVVQWVGHPADGLDEAIDQSLSGKFDLEKSKAAFDALTAAAREAIRKEAELQELMKPFGEAMQGGDMDAAFAELDKVEAKRPDVKSDLAELRFKVLLSAGKPVAPLGKKYLEDYKDDAETLNSLAWAIVDPEMKWPTPDIATALLLSQRAAEKSEMKDGMILDTYALALFKSGDRTKAVEIQTRAVDLSKTDKRVDADTLKEMQARLEQFKKPNV